MRRWLSFYWRTRAMVTKPYSNENNQRIHIDVNGTRNHWHEWISGKVTEHCTFWEHVRLVPQKKSNNNKKKLYIRIIGRVFSYFGWLSINYSLNSHLAIISTNIKFVHNVFHIRVYVCGNGSSPFVFWTLNKRTSGLAKLFIQIIRCLVGTEHMNVHIFRMILCLVSC